MKKGSNWYTTHGLLRTDKDIKRLYKKIFEILERGGDYYIDEVSYTKKMSTAQSIIHYILNYYDIKRKGSKND